MMLPYVLLGVVVCVVIYLLWVYYFLFYKEKPRNPAPGIFNIQNQELFFPQAKKKSGTGKFAIAGLFIAPGRRKKNEKDELKTKDGNEAFPKNDKFSEEVHSGYFSDSDKKEVKEEKSVHFESEVRSNSPKGFDQVDNYKPERETDPGYGTLNNDGASGSW